MRRIAPIFALLSGITLIGQVPTRDGSPQNPPAATTGTGSIRGLVLAADTGSPLRNARVALASENGEVSPVVTDAGGRFTFTALPAGHYVVTAGKPGYATSRLGARRSTDRPIRLDVRSGTAVDNVEIRIARGGAITGRVLDEFGEPIPIATVAAQLIVRADGRMNATTVATADTDDLGEYRIGGLPAGRYVVGLLTTGNMGMFGIGPDGVFGAMSASLSRTYYPGARSLAQAQAMTVRAGEEVPRVDLTAAHTRQATVSVSVVDAEGNPASANVSFGSDSPLLNLPAMLMVGPPNSNATARLDPSEWAVFARGAAGVGIAQVHVGSDDTAVTVTLVKGGRISGRVVTDNGLPLPAGIQLEAVPVEDAIARAAISGPARIDPSGAFETINLLGARELRLRSPSGWSLKDVLFEGRSVNEAPFVFQGGENLTGVRVVLTNQYPTLSGTVVDAQNAVVSDYSVLAFPESESLLRNARRWARWSRSDHHGRFTIDDALPGTYLVVAVDEVDDVEWLNADYLNQFRARAARVTLDASEKKTITLPLVSLR